MPAAREPMGGRAVRRSLKVGRWALLPAAAALLLAACGGGGSGSTTTTSAKSATTAGKTTTTAAAQGSSTSQASSGKVTNVTLGYVPYDDDAPLFLGIKKGFFKQHGLNITLTPAQAPDTIIASMVSGHQQFGFVTVNILLNAVSKGTSIKCVSSVDGGQTTDTAKDTTDLLASKKSGITSIKQLQGKTVAVVQLHSLNSADVREEVDLHGGDGSKVNLISLPFPQMPAALQAGRVAAAVVVAPFTETALANGAKVLAHPNLELFPGGTIVCFAATSKYIQEHKDVVNAFQAGMLQSIAYAKTHQSEALATLPLHLKVTAAEAQKQSLTGNFDPKLNAASVNKQEQILLKFGDLQHKIPVSSIFYNPPAS